jgi:aminopeptidase
LSAAVPRVDRYADLIVRVGANVQPGQTLFVNAGLEHAELVRAMARSAYRAGAAYVDVRYSDQHVRRAMIAGEAEPELLADLDPDRVGRAMPIEMFEKMLEIQNARGVNWTIAAFPTAGWAEQIFGTPDVERLWDAIAATVRLDDDDPVAAWRAHSARLRSRCAQLDNLALDALRFEGPGRTPRRTATSGSSRPGTGSPGSCRCESWPRTRMSGRRRPARAAPPPAAWRAPTRSASCRTRSRSVGTRRNCSPYGK